MGTYGNISEGDAETDDNMSWVDANWKSAGNWKPLLP